MEGRKKKNNTQVCGLWSLPDEIVVNCLAHVSRLDLAAFAMTSKSHRCLVASPELWDLRWELGCIDPSLYVCLHFPPNPTPRWFILHPVQRRLRPIYPRLDQSLSRQPQSSSSFVMIAWGIFVIGGIRYGNPVSDVLFFDCLKHTWYRIRPMKMPRVSPSACLIDWKIYVFGGLGDEAYSSNWAEVFDLKTQTWEFLFVSYPRNIQQSVLIDNKDLYAVDEDGEVLSFSPSKCTFVESEKTDSTPRCRNDWCLIGTLLFCRGIYGRILWCEPYELNWKEVNGLEELLQPNDYRFNIKKLCSNPAGNIVIFWYKQRESLELWCAEISVEKREVSSELWGKIEWSSAVLELDHTNVAYTINVLCADYVTA